MNEVTLLSILDIIVKRIWAIILAAAVFAGATYLYSSNFVEPTYSATSAILTTNGGIVSDANEIIVNTTSKIGSSDIASSLNIIETYVDIIKTHGFFEEVAKHPKVSGYGYNAETLRAMTSVERRSEYSLLIDITVTCSEPEHAKNITNCISEIAPEYTQSLINNSYVKQVDKCVVAKRVGPLTVRNSIFMGLVGALLTVGLFTLLVATDTTIKGEDDIVKKYNIPVLGTVPDFDQKSKKGAK